MHKLHILKRVIWQLVVPFCVALYVYCKVSRHFMEPTGVVDRQTDIKRMMSSEDL